MTESSAILLVGLVGLLLYSLAGALYRDRRAGDGRAFGRLISHRYPADDVPPAQGTTGFGRISKGRSKRGAYTAAH